MTSEAPDEAAAPQRQGGPGISRPRLRRRIANALLVVLGLALICYPLTVGANLRCYDRQLERGQSCLKADGSPGQSYNERVGNAAAARPIMITLGVLVAGFGATLLVVDLRRSRRLS